MVKEQKFLVLQQDGEGAASKVAGLEECPFEGVCNPLKNFTWTFNDSQVDYSTMCDDGHTNRLCAQCSPGYYRTELGCQASLSLCLFIMHAYWFPFLSNFSLHVLLLISYRVVVVTMECCR